MASRSRTTAPAGKAATTATAKRSAPRLVSLDYRPATTAAKASKPAPAALALDLPTAGRKRARDAAVGQLTPPSEKKRAFAVEDEDAHDRQPLAPLSSTPDGAASSSGGPSTRRRRTTRATASLPTPSHTSPGGDDDDDDDDRRRRRHSGAAATAHAEDLTPPAARRRRTSESAGAPTPAAADTDASPPEPAADPLRQRLNATDESAGPIYPLATHLQVVLPVAPARPEYYAEPVANLYREDIDSMEVRVWGWSAEQELEFLPTPNYLHRHPDLSPRIRLILVDWLFEVADEFGLQRETVYLAVNYVDRYLSVVKNCARDVIQLLGVTCLFLAAKLEEVRPPVVQDYARVTAGLHTCLDVRQTELLVLAKLNWKMSAPTANGWVNLYLNNAARRAQRLRGLTRDPAYGLDFGPKYSPRELANVMATVDYCIHHEDSLRFSYSMLAAAALKVHGIDDSTGVSPITGFDEAHLAECLDFVRQFVHLPRRFQPRPPSNAQPPLTEHENKVLQQHNKALLDQVMRMQENRPTPTMRVRPVAAQ